MEAKPPGPRSSASFYLPEFARTVVIRTAFAWASSLGNGARAQVVEI